MTINTNHVVDSLTPSSNILDISGATGALTVPTGTTAQRPASPVAGQCRYNTTLNQTEIYSGTGWVSITSQTYSVSYLIAGGGGGASSGGGGAGSSTSTGTAGTANTGGGGGGGGQSSTGGTGGSGIVIISYAGSQRGTGGTVTSSGGNTIHTFTTSGTYTA